MRTMFSHGGAGRTLFRRPLVRLVLLLLALLVLVLVVSAVVAF
jgi:hypothetical protein